MLVRELIEKLQAMPQDLPVGYVYDGAARGSADFVWQCRGMDEVLIATERDPVYSDCQRPEWAPSEKEDRYWRTPKAEGST